MKKISLSLKITTLFALVSFITVIFLYVLFSSLFEKYTLKTEKEKVSLIAETIEPMVAMNAYLGLADENKNIVKNIFNRKFVLGGTLTINNKNIFEKKFNDTLDHFSVDYIVKDPISATPLGLIHIAYSMEAFNLAVDKMRQEVIYYLGLMSVFFLVFLLVIRYILFPLNLIAQRVKEYKLGDQLDFSNIRMEPETQSIRDAFSLMVDNLHEHTLLLEQYKHSVDESSIVSKVNPDGTVNYVNDEFIRVSGYPRESVLGANCSIIFHSEIGSATFDDIWSTLKSKKIWKGVLKNQNNLGEAYYVKSTIVPLLDENDEILEYISIQHDITQVIEQGEKIQQQTTDKNTGLPNRIKLSEDIAPNKTIIFALFSLDNYNIIKDYYGYSAAFNSIRQLAIMLHKLLDPKGIQVYKLAGGEFGFLAKEAIDLDWFKQICHFAIEKTESFQAELDDVLIDFRATVGFTTSKEKYLSYAGLALRHALESKTPIIYYEDQENLIALHEANIIWTKKIKAALADNRITLFAQPLVDSKTMETTKYECLVRLIDDDGQYVSPFHFLDVSKKTKLYSLISKQVISLSFDVFSQIPDKEFSINLSAEDILHKETVDFLESKIRQYNIGKRVVLEIVESEGIDSFEEVNDFILKMKSLGCKIAIDDFGTGYSNFSYLMKLNVDYIKVDGSLIKDIDHNPNSQAICKTILNFSKTLEISTVAEFVHNEDVLNYVKKLGFDYLQGFHLGEPTPIHSLLQEEI